PGRAVLAPGERITGIVELTRPALLSTTVSLGLLGPKDDKFRPTVWRNGIPVVDLTPLPDENVGKVTVSIGAGYGAAWLPDGQKLPSTDSTSVQEARLRIGRGMTEHIDIEAELAY